MFVFTTGVLRVILHQLARKTAADTMPTSLIYHAIIFRIMVELWRLYVAGQLYFTIIRTLLEMVAFVSNFSLKSWLYPLINL